MPEALPLPSPAPPATRVPAGVFAAQDYERIAEQQLPAPLLAHIAGGSGSEITLRANRSAFAQQAICPRQLRDVAGGHTRLRLAGQDLLHPLLIAPVAHQQLVHAQAELDTARAAAATDSVMVVSTLASRTLEAIAQAAGPQADAPLWFQLYWQPRREDTLALLRRAESAGYRALVLTLDAPVQPQSLRALRAGFRLPAEAVAANLAGQAPFESPALRPGESRIFRAAMDQAPTPADLDWLLAQSRLPLWVKGVLHADDARRFQARGVAGQIVSNHGGRALDGAPASLQVLPAIRAAVGDAHPLLLDGGIRSGSDAFKALALGADAVLLGRLPLYALAAAGALGVAHLMKLLREELELCMALAGCATLADVRGATLLPPGLPSLPPSRPPSQRAGDDETLRSPNADADHD